MVRFTLALTLLLAAATNAKTYCQCLFNDGSHCCVTSKKPDQDCTASCLHEQQYYNPASFCDAGGKWSKVSTWDTQSRMVCVGL